MIDFGAIVRLLMSEVDNLRAFLFSKYGVALAILFGFPATYVIFADQPKNGEAESSYEALKRSGATEAQLCQAARSVLAEQIGAGNREKARLWEAVASSQCVSASACAAIVGGCPALLRSESQK